MSAGPVDPKTRLGTLGERAAEEELFRRGYRIVARNYHCRGGEADLVAEEGETLVFVEVKTRAGLRHGLPREAVGWKKQQRLGAAAEHYCYANGIEDRPVRFDVVEVVILRHEIAAVELIRDAFVPEG
jgi:putative endonuclease